VAQLCRTAFSQNIADALSSCAYGTLRSSGTTAASSALTLGGTAPSSVYYTLALAEILAAPDATLAEVATATASALVPGDFATTSLTLPAVFASPPAGGTLLVAMVSANSNWGNGNASFTVADSYGLTWVLLAQAQFPSYSGVWIAQVPVYNAALSVVPSFAAAVRVAALAALTVSPVLSAAGASSAVTASAALTVAPSFAPLAGAGKSAGLTVVPVFTARRSRTAPGTSSNGLLMAAGII
jgi:hypothetical protein